MPGPGAGDDFFHVLELWFPAEFGADFFRAGDEARWVAGAARLFDDGDHSGNAGPLTPALRARRSRLARRGASASFAA